MNGDTMRLSRKTVHTIVQMSDAFFGRKCSMTTAHDKEKYFLYEMGKKELRVIMNLHA